MSEERLKFEHLPKSVIPLVYDVTIDSNLEALTFKGKVEIDCDVVEGVSAIIMNARDLDVSSAVVCQNDVCMMAQVSYVKDEQRVVLSLKSELLTGKAKISMEFTGIISDSLFGYYYTPDKTHPGKNSAVTQFEPTDARRAFPCWDEPEFKAQFDITMIGDKELTLISNMNEISSEPLPGNEIRKVVKFARTPKMSTYLVAFAAGLFEYIEKVDKNGIVHRVYADYGKMPECQAALEASVEALQYLTDFFKIDYPLPKCDSLAVERFDFGAMENWGLVVYRTNYLYLEPKGTGNAALQLVYEVISHELTHQWFGNLVTMKWWTHVWLNEGFANFIQNVVTDYIRPDFEMWTQFISDALTRALSLDSLRSSHPVEVDVGHPSEVREIFDDISYNKGCSLNRMLYFFLGKEKFVQGLSNYLNHFAYSNASTNDLWKFLGEAADMDLESVMASWTRQTGFPVVIVEEMTQLTPNKMQLKLSQKRHLDDGGEDELNALWSIPISIISQSSPKEPVAQFVMRSKTHVVEVEGISESDWVHLNPGFVGMYLVSYPKDNMKLLSNIVKQSPNGDILTAESRSALLYEKLRLAISGQSTIVELLELVKYYVGDQHFLIWHNVLEVFRCLNPIFHGAGCDSSKVDKFKMKVFEKIATKIGMEKKEGENESHLTELLRTMIISEMGKLGHPETVAFCRSLFNNFIKNNKPISPKIRDSVLKVVGSNILDKEEIDALISLYQASSSNEEKRSLLSAMGCVKGKELALKVVEFVVSDQIPTGDQNFSFEQLGSNMELGHFLLNYCEEHFEKLRDATGGIESRSLNFVMKQCTNPFWKTEDLAAAERIYKTYKFERFKRALDQNKEMVSIREIVIAREGEALKAYFDNL